MEAKKINLRTGSLAFTVVVLALSCHFPCKSQHPQSAGIKVAGNRATVRSNVTGALFYENRKHHFALGGLLAFYDNQPYAGHGGFADYLWYPHGNTKKLNLFLGNSISYTKSRFNFSTLTSEIGGLFRNYNDRQREDFESLSAYLSFGFRASIHERFNLNVSYFFGLQCYKSTGSYGRLPGNAAINRTPPMMQLGINYAFLSKHSAVDKK